MGLALPVATGSAGSLRLAVPLARGGSCTMMARMVRAAGGVLWRSGQRGCGWWHWCTGSGTTTGRCRRKAPPRRAPAGHRLPGSGRGDRGPGDGREAAGHRTLRHGPRPQGRGVMQAMHGPDGPFTPTAEVDRLAWMPLANARWRLRYRRDCYMIDMLETLADSALRPPRRSCWCATPAPCPPGAGKRPQATVRWMPGDGIRPRPCAGRCRRLRAVPAAFGRRDAFRTRCGRWARSSAAGRNRAGLRRRGICRISRPWPDPDPGTRERRRYLGRVRARRCDPAPAHHPRRGRGPGREGISSGKGQRVGVVLFQGPGSPGQTTIRPSPARDADIADDVVLLRYGPTATGVPGQVARITESRTGQFPAKTLAAHPRGAGQAVAVSDHPGRIPR